MSFVENPLSVSEKIETEGQFAKQFIELEALNNEVIKFKKNMKKRTEIGPETEEEKKRDRLLGELSCKLGPFFEGQSKTVVPVELSAGGLYDHDAIKFFPDGQILVREIFTSYDMDDMRYRFCDSMEAKKLLEESISEDNEKIEKLTERKNMAKKALEELL